MRYADPVLIDQLAGAFVLGTLSAGAHRRFERLRTSRPDVALAVREWETRLGFLASTVPPVQAPSRVWRAIDARTREADESRGVLHWLFAGWGLAGVLSGVAIAFVVMLAAPTLFVSAEQVALRSDGKLPASYVGLLTDAQGNGKVLVSSLRHGHTMTVKAIGPIDVAAPGESLVLWAVPTEGAPFVLGTVPTKGSSTSELPQDSEQLLAKVTKLVVTRESGAQPASPGAVLYRGNCAKLW